MTETSAASSSTQPVKRQVLAAATGLSLTFINDRLIAQGLMKHPLELGNLSEREEDNVTRVLSALLQFRADDLELMEGISTAHKILTRDHERLTGMYKKLKSQVGVIEREKEAAKSQLSGVAEKLKREQEAHRLARDEVNKSRTALAFVRTQAQVDNKRRDTHLEKTMQNYQRLASENSRLLAANITTGLVCLNPIPSNENIPRVDSFWDPNIRALNAMREGLQEECEAFRHVTLSTANQLQEIVGMKEGQENIPWLTPSAFFNLPSPHSQTAPNQMSSTTSHPSAADLRLRDLLTKLRASIEEDKERRDSGEEGDLEEERRGRVREGLEMRVRALEGELASSKALVEEGQKMLAEFVERSNLVDIEVTPPSPGPDTSRDEEDRLRAQKEMLEEERGKLTASVVRLGEERLALEAERTAFAEQKRSQQLESLLSDLPSTPPVPAIEAAPLFSPIPELPESPVPTPSTPPPNRRPLLPTSAHKHASPARPVVSSPLRGRSPSAGSASARKRVVGGKKLGTPLSRVALTRATIEAISERKKGKALLGTSGVANRGKATQPETADLVRASKSVKTVFGSRLGSSTSSNPSLSTSTSGKRTALDTSAAGGKDRLGRSNLGKEWEAKMAAGQLGEPRVTGVTDRGWRASKVVREEGDRSL